MQTSSGTPFSFVCMPFDRAQDGDQEYHHRIFLNPSFPYKKWEILREVRKHEKMGASGKNGTSSSANIKETRGFGFSDSELKSASEHAHLNSSRPKNGSVAEPETRTCQMTKTYLAKFSQLSAQVLDPRSLCRLDAPTRELQNNKERFPTFVSFREIIELYWNQCYKGKVFFLLFCGFRRDRSRISAE